MAVKFEFKKAIKHKEWGRLGICGPSGSGKTWTSLMIGQEFIRLGYATKMALIDSEKRSSALYADDFDFDMLSLETHAPLTYVEAINAAVKAGYDFVIVDGITQAWTGKEGALEQVDIAAKRAQSNNKFNGWRDVTPMHNALIEALVGSPCHLIATMRVKTEYVVEKDEKTGKSVPRKIGVQPIQRDGMEYEFTVMLDMNAAHEALISKTRCSLLDGKIFMKPGREFSEIFGGWLAGGAEREERQKTAEEIATEAIIALLADKDVKDAFDLMKTPDAKRMAAAEKYKTKELLMPIIKARLEEHAKEAKKASAAAADEAKKAAAAASTAGATSEHEGT